MHIILFKIYLYNERYANVGKGCWWSIEEIVVFLYERHLQMCKRTKAKGAFSFGFDMDIFMFQYNGSPPPLLRNYDFWSLYKMYFFLIF